jgi:hypothetical protein
VELGESDDLGASEGLRASEGLGASEEDDVPEGESGGVGPGLRRSSGIESDELAAVEGPCAEPDVVTRDEPGLSVGIVLPFPSAIAFRELGVGGKLRESGEGSSLDCRGTEGICKGGKTCF